MLIVVRAMRTTKLKYGNVKKKIYHFNRPWRPIGLLAVKDPALSRQPTHRWR
jgi:hypothetical protein